MMRWIVGASLRSRGLVLAVGAGVMLLGIIQLRDAPVDVLPEFSPPTVEVRTEALGLSANEVEQLITAPMEQNLLNGVAFLDEIRSESIPGLSSIELVFERGTDILDARQVVQERLTQASGALPNVSKPPQMLQPLSSTSRVLMIGLTSEELSLIDMSVLARWTVRPRLMGVPGVANVAVWGQRDRQLQVQVDPERLRANNVTLEQVVRTVGNSPWVSPLTYLPAHNPGTGGFFDGENQRFQIHHINPIKEARDLAQVSLEGTSGSMTLGDVATVVEDTQPLIGDAVLEGGAGLMLVVEKFPEANALDVTRGVDDALDTLAPGLSGVEMDTSIFRRASYIERSIDNLGVALLIGLGLLLLALGAFFFDWRTALISLVAIVLSLVAAGLVLHLRGATVNTMVVGGLILAILVVVDDAIVDRENISRRLRQHRSNGSNVSPASLIVESSLAMRRPMAFATLIIAVALVPLFVLKGESGAFLPPLALSYLVAVLASMVVALTVTPALSLLLQRNAPLHRRETVVVQFLQRGYRRLLPQFMRSPRLAFLALGLAALVGLAAVPLLDRDGSLVPSFKDSDLLIHWDAAPGTSLTEMSRITGRVSNELRSLAGVRSVGAHAGRAVMSDQVVGSNSSEVWVSLDPSTDYDTTVAAVQGVVESYPGLERAVLTYPSDRITDVLGTTSSDDLTVRVYGSDLEVLREKAGEVRQALAGVEGIEDPRVELAPDEPTLEVAVDLTRAQAAGIKPGDVRRAAATLLSGIEVGSLFEEQKVFEVMVVGTPEVRRNLTDVQDLRIDTPTNGQVRLGDVAELQVAPNPNVIRHEDVSRSIDVVAGVPGGDVGSVAAEVEDRLREVEFPIEHHAEVLGDFAEREASRTRFIGVALAAALGVFLLLQAALASWRLAVLVFLVLPVALVGGVLAALADGGTVSIGMLAGFFAVLALAVRNALALIDHCRQLEGESRASGPAVVQRAAHERLVPTALTAAAAGLALLPLVVLGDAPGLEVVHPMAVVILGGLVTSTLLSLFVLPALYLRFASPPTAESAQDSNTVIDLTALERDGAGRDDGDRDPTRRRLNV